MKQTSQLVAELQATRSPEAAVRRALERVGEQISGILQRAHETAEQITAQSRSEAEDRLEAGAPRGGARSPQQPSNDVKDLDAETDRIWAERQQIVEDTAELADASCSALAETAAERFPAAEDEPGRSPRRGPRRWSPRPTPASAGRSASPSRRRGRTRFAAETRPTRRASRRRCTEPPRLDVQPRSRHRSQTGRR